MKKSFELIIQVLLLVFPWSVRLIFFRLVLGAKIAKGAKIGRSLIVNIGKIELAENATIGHLNIIRNMDRLVLGKNASIGTFNWIAGNPTNRNIRSFNSFPARISQLLIGDESAIVARHILDCTDSVRIGNFSTIAGHRSQILTHGIDVRNNLQSCSPITIGDYCYVGTSVVILKGASLPSYSILSAGSTLTSKRITDEYAIYSGNPAQKTKDLDQSSMYFTRKTGFVF